jgi:hypothetical protein
VKLRLWCGIAGIVVVFSGGTLRAQAPQAPDRSVQVGVPQGSAQDQAAGAARQQQQQQERARLASEPPPRRADGRILIGSTPTLPGVWVGGNLGFCNSNTVTPPPSLNPGIGRGGGAAPAGATGAAGGTGGTGGGSCTPVPYMPWTLAVSNDRRRNELEPHTRCKPSGGPRQWLTPYGAEFVEFPELQVAYIFDIGGPHTYRTIYMDGRTHPRNLMPSYYGHSIGWWDGDTLVVETVGFNEGFWLDRGQLPHTEQLRLLEKYTRTSVGTMRYELTIDDPGAYTARFTGVSTLRWENGVELFEYICQQANQADTLMVGDGTSADRSSPVVP